MFKRTKVCTAALVALSGSLALVGTSVLAQDQTQRIEITGSAIKRIAAETALPIQVLTRADIDRSGVQSVTELIQNLPSMQGFSQSSSSVGGGGGGYSDASIHSIGGTRTLVLLNGHRLATWAGQTLTGSGSGIDLNGIPLAAVERVEVLTDGASAIYGTDAIAGVVNFILRKDLQSGEISANVVVPHGNVGKNYVLSASKGWGNLDSDGYNVMFSLAYDKQEQMKATDRSFAKTGVIPFTNDGTNYVFFNGSVRAVPANYEIVDHATQGTVRDLIGNPYYNANNKCPTGHVYRGGFCRFDYTATIEILPQSERTAVFGSFSKKLNKDHTFGLNLAVSDFSLTSRIAPPPVDILIPTDSAVYNKYMPGGTNVLDATSVWGDDLYAYWRGVDVGNRTTKDHTTAVHLTASLSGIIADWDYNAAFTHSENKWEESYLGGWLMQNQQDAALASAAFDPFLEPGKQSAAGKTALAGMQFYGKYKSEKSTLNALELRGSKGLFALAGGQAQLGAGIDLRRESVKYSPSDLAMGQGNNIAGDSASERPFDVSRNIWGAYLELVAPIAKNFELDGALRHDRYGDFGSADNAKLSAKFSPVKEFLIRGSFGTGFRAPSVPQVSAGLQQYGVTGNTYNCPAAALAAMQQIDPLAACRPDGSQYDVFASGNKSLKPEKSQQFALGFRFEPTSWVSMGADFWHVEIRDRISQLTEGTVMNNSASYLKNFRVFIDPGTKKHYVALYVPNENLGKERYSGVDLDGKMLFNTPIGKLTSALQWTHIFSYNYQRIKDGPWFSNLSVYNDSSVTFKNIIRWTNSLKVGNFDNTLAANYKSGYLDQPCTRADCGLVRIVNSDGSVGGTKDMTTHRVDSYLTFDIQTKYLFNKSTTLTAGILNVANTDPPLTLKTEGGHQLGYDNRYTDPRGRTFYLNASYKF